MLNRLIIPRKYCQCKIVSHDKIQSPVIGPSDPPLCSVSVRLFFEGRKWRSSSGSSKFAGEILDKVSLEYIALHVHTLGLFFDPLGRPLPRLTGSEIVGGAVGSPIACLGGFSTMDGVWDGWFGSDSDICEQLTQNFVDSLVKPKYRVLSVAKDQISYECEKCEVREIINCLFLHNLPCTRYETLNTIKTSFLQLNLVQRWVRYDGWKLSGESVTLLSRFLSLLVAQRWRNIIT